MVEAWVSSRGRPMEKATDVYETDSLQWHTRSPQASKTGQICAIAAWYSICQNP
jgi:hypothetical protein